MGMVPSYEDNEWQVVISHRTVTGTAPVIQIRVLEDDGEWRDYWVPQDPGNSDYAQYQEWLADGNEPTLIF